MRTLLYLVVGIVLVAVVAIVAVPFVVSTAWIRDQVTAAVRDQTGRELTIAGDASFSLFPNIALVVSQAALSNPPDRKGSLARMEELDLGLNLLPLLSGRVEVDRFIMTRPVISLEIDQAGNENWNFARNAGGEAGSGGVETPSAAAGEEGRPAANEGLSGLEAVQLGDIRLVDGIVTFQDERSGAYQEVRDINTTISLTSLDDPLDVEGRLSWQGEEIAFTLALTEPRALATGTPSSVSVEIESPHLQAGFSGTLAAKEQIDATGDVQIASPSVKNLIRWLGTVPPQLAGLENFSLAGAMQASAGEFALSNAQVVLDDMNAEGGLLVSMIGEKPLVQATLAVDGMDINPYLGPKSDGGGDGGGSGGGGGSSAQSGPAGASGWSTEPIDVAGLQLLDADLRLSTRSLRFQNIQAGQSALAVTLKDGVMTVDLSELQLYEGRAVGRLTVNAANETPAIALSFSVADVAALPALTDAVSLEWLEGRGEITGTLASRGSSERQLVGALNGELAVRFTDGAIRGFNISQMLRGLSGGAATNWSRNDSDKTDFSEFSATFAVAKGVAQTSDLQMLGPLVRLSGAGVANLPQQSVDFRISPKVVASLEGQGGAVDLSGIEVPILIRGPWNRPAITPDLEGLLRDPQKAIETIEQIGDQIKNLQNGDGLGGVVDQLTGGQAPQQLLESVLGGGQQGDANGVGGGEPQSPAPIAEDVFNRLLGR